MKLKKKSKTFLINFFLVLFCSCVHAPQKKLAPIFDLHGFVNEVSLKNPSIQSLTTKTKMKIVNKDQSYRFKSGLLMSHDRYFYMETYGFGVPQGYVSMVDDQLVMVFPSRNEIFRGKGTSSLSKILNLNISLNDLFDPILRSVLISQGAEPKMGIFGKYYVLEDSVKNRFFITSSKWIEKIELANGCQIEYGESWSDKISYPRSIELNCKEQSIHIDFEELEINQVIQKSSFQIDIPPTGFHVYSIE